MDNRHGDRGRQRWPEVETVTENTKFRAFEYKKLCYHRRTARRAVSRNLVNCCTTVGTTCTTNREQIEVMQLEGYSRPTCNKLYASSNYPSNVIGASQRLDRQRVLLITPSTYRGKIF